MKLRWVGVLLLVVCVGAGAQNPAVNAHDQYIDGPATTVDFSTWIAGMKQWRTEQLKRIGYESGEYDRPELKWAQRAYMQPQMMVEDRYFYDPVAQKYTVDRYLDDLEKRFGGIDAVLIWPTYPNIGVDDRNQFDMFHDLPGGMDGVKQMVADFHKRGVRVLFPVMLWDQGTHAVSKPEAEVLSEQLAAVGADGINGDTMTEIPMTFRKASDKTGHPLVFEPEVMMVDSALSYDNMTWLAAAQTNLATTTVLVDKYKWLEPRHMSNISDRWQRDKTADLQFDFFNGVGMETWENVWGVWNGMPRHDEEMIRRVAKVERAFSDLLISPGWEPHTPVLQTGVFASKWPGEDKTLWTMVNKNEFDVSGEQIDVPYRNGMKFYDVWHGDELTPEIHGSVARLSFAIEAAGFGAVLAVDGDAAAYAPLFRELHDLNKMRLDSFSKLPVFLQQTQVAIAATKRAKDAPAGMVLIPAGTYDFRVSGVEIEGQNRIGLDVQYPWEDSARRDHRHTLEMAAFYMDRDPVTNAEFKKFLDATKYHPADDHNFLKDWKDGAYPQGWDAKPVTWVSIEDARAYAAWAGKRLPHEWEWQYAAQGSDDRAYPWGTAAKAGAVPVLDRGRTMRGPDDVTAHPDGASPFGVEDMTGNVWQWTDEYVDEHTRAAIVRGGSYYYPEGSKWYSPQNLRLHQHGKLLLMAPGRDRAGTIGFRCVVDAVKNGEK